jgi:hypothetical protein
MNFTLNIRREKYKNQRRGFKVANACFNQHQREGLTSGNPQVEVNCMQFSFHKNEYKDGLRPSNRE